MKLKTRLYVTLLAVITFPGVREALVWLADHIFNTDFAPFYRLWINFAGGFVVVALVADLLWELWDDHKYRTQYREHLMHYATHAFKKLKD